MYFYGYRQHQPHAFVNKLKLKTKLCYVQIRVSSSANTIYTTDNYLLQ